MASNQGLNSLATIIKRLEAATSRLEDIAEAQALAKAAPSTAAATSQASAHITSAPPAPPPPPPEDPAVIQAYDAEVVPHVEAFVKLSGELDPLLKEQAALVLSLFTAQRAIIVQATACSKPATDAIFQGILAPVAKGIGEVNALKDNNRRNRDLFNHLSAVAEGIPALAWLTQSPKPAPFIAEMKNAAQFYSNRVMKDFKDKDKRHVDWTRSLDSLIESLRKYVFDHHTTGLAWNPKGRDPTKYIAPSSATSAPPASASGAPPPPPPPPAPPAAPSPPSPGAAATPAVGGAAAVFAEINKGSDITKGLRHVSKDQMTHKNPELRASGIIPAKASKTSPTASPVSGKKPVRPAKPSSLAGKKPTKMALEGNKWIVEFFENETNLVIEHGEISQSVNLFGCKNSTLQILGKVNAVTLVNCSRTSVLVENVVSSVSITSSPSFTVQITGKAPTIQLDSTDGGQIYLSAASAAEVEITSAKCSAINVSLPVKNEQGEEEEGLFVEKAMPEMLRTVIQNRQLVSSIIEPSG